MLVVVLLEVDQLPLKISGGPEQQAIQTFAAYTPNQPFDDRMGPWRVRHCLDFPDVEDPQVRPPLMKPVQRIMVRTEIGGQGLAVGVWICFDANRPSSTRTGCSS